MRVIRKIEDEIKEVEYPHLDIATPVVGLSKGIVYYYIENIPVPEYDSNKSYIKPKDTLINIPHSDYPHLFICERGYVVIDYPQSAVIEKLNNAVGEWIESRIPVWKQIKYLSRFMYLDILKKEGTATDLQLQEIAYLNDLDNWVIKCRADRDVRENEYLTNGIFPSFIFDEMPIKNF